MRGVKKRGIMTKIKTGPNHNQNTPSGGFEQSSYDARKNLSQFFFKGSP